jgi:hypothetical protein
MERRVHDFIAREPSISGSDCDVADLPAPSFNKRDCQVLGFKRTYWRQDRPVGKCQELFPDELDRALNLEPSHIRTGEYISCAPRRHRQLSEPVDASRKMVTYISLNAARTGGWPHHAECPACFFRHLSCVLKSGLNRCRVPEKCSRSGHVSKGRAQPLKELALSGIVEIETNSTGPHHAAPETATADKRAQVQEVTPDATAVRGGGKETDIASECSKIAGMVGKPLKFQRNTADSFTAYWHLTPRECFDRLAVCHRVSDRRVPSDFLHDWQGTLGGATQKHSLDPAVLVAQRDLEMKYLLTVALKAEVPRFDDPGMNRPDRDLVNLFASNLVVVHHTNNRFHSRQSAPRIVTGAVGRVETHGFEPGVTLGNESELLGDFPLEQVNLRAAWSERKEPFSFNQAAPDPKQ